jgi:nuclease S1
MLALFLAGQMATPAWAWGRIGHRLTARIAEKHLNAKAKAAVAALLGEGESIADASTWADEQKRQIKGSAPWHYVDVPLDEDRYDSRFSGPGAEKGCIVDKIHEFQDVLKDPKRSIEDRWTALRFLIHLVGDLHMPLHVGDNHDRGGNDTQIRFFDRGSNMHRVWDSDIIGRAGDNEEIWLTDLNVLDTPESRAVAMRGAVEDWAKESLRAARAAYQEPTTGIRIKSGEKLSDAYLKANLPVVRQRLFQGGVRLAMMLNDVFPEN